MKNLSVYDNAFNIGLPKWPAFTVIGEDVTQVQAAEILIRTDIHLPDFEYAGNSRELRSRLSEIFRVPIHDDIFKKPVDERFDIMQPHWAAVHRLKKRLGILPLDYLVNAQIVSSYIGGPHGWVNWAGQVFSTGDNIGKWPSVEEVAKEWACIAKAFPFLDLKCQLYDKEACEDANRPLVTFEVNNGRVVARPADSQYLVVAEPDIKQWATNCVTMNTIHRESGIPVHQLREKVIEVYGRVPMYHLSKKDIEERKALKERLRQEAETAND